MVGGRDGRLEGCRLGTAEGCLVGADDRVGTAVGFLLGGVVAVLPPLTACWTWTGDEDGVGEEGALLGARLPIAVGDEVGSLVGAFEGGVTAAPPAEGARVGIVDGRELSELESRRVGARLGDTLGQQAVGAVVSKLGVVAVVANEVTLAL